jgi:hypothetical protein
MVEAASAIRQIRACQPSDYARSGVQITRFGASLGGHIGDRVADHIGG